MLSCLILGSLIWMTQPKLKHLKFAEKHTVSLFYYYTNSSKLLNVFILSINQKNKKLPIFVWILEMKHDSELKYFKDMALYIKKAMEEEFEDSWHVIVGTNFGSFVSYEHKNIILFWLEHIGFLLFKHGWSCQLIFDLLTNKFGFQELERIWYLIFSFYGFKLL